MKKYIFTGFRLTALLFCFTISKANAQEIPKDTALLIVDIQYFYFPGGDAELVDPEQASQNAAMILDYFRASIG